VSIAISGNDVDRYRLRLRPAVMKELARLGPRAADFETETGRLDGTAAPIVERLMGVIVEARGPRMIETGAPSSAYLAAPPAGERAGTTSPAGAG